MPYTDQQFYGGTHYGNEYQREESPVCLWLPCPQSYCGATAYVSRHHSRPRHQEAVLQAGGQATFRKSGRMVSLFLLQSH